MKIRLVETADGPRITVDYESDEGALGHEHERDHREAVAKLLGLGVGDLAALGVSVERSAPESAGPAVEREAQVVGGAAPIKTG